MGGASVSSGANLVSAAALPASDTGRSLPSVMLLFDLLLPLFCCVGVCVIPSFLCTECSHAI